MARRFYRNESARVPFWTCIKITKKTWMDSSNTKSLGIFWKVWCSLLIWGAFTQKMAKWLELADFRSMNIGVYDLCYSLRAWKVSLCTAFCVHLYHIAWPSLTKSSTGTITSIVVLWAKFTKISTALSVVNFKLGYISWQATFRTSHDGASICSRSAVLAILILNSIRWVPYTLHNFRALSIISVQEL
jgi:hypothetical protein